MARAIEIDPAGPGSGGEGTPGDPGYVPAPQMGAVLAVVVTGSSVTFTSDQITGAGGPWPSFSVRVTPINDTGAGPSATYSTTSSRRTEAGDQRITESGDMRVGE